jgi:uncharacterized membrane protein YgcG
MLPAHHDLTPTEAQVLLEPNTTPGRSAVRTTLLHLAATGHLRPEVQPRRSWLDAGGKRVARGQSAVALPEHVAVVLEALFPAGSEQKPLAPTEMLGRLQKAFGYDYGRYLSGHIRPLLVRRGALEVEEYVQLLVIRRRRYRHTAHGARLRDQVEAKLRAAGDVLDAVYRDPPRAAALAAQMGGLILISAALRPHLHTLSQAADPSTSATPLIVELNAADEEERRNGWLDGVEMFSDVDWGSILDSIDGMGDAFDAGGDGGGGDGGGGDGGGGGE